MTKKSTQGLTDSIFWLGFLPDRYIMNKDRIVIISFPKTSKLLGSSSKKTSLFAKADSQFSGGFSELLFIKIPPDCTVGILDFSGDLH